jgi:hypothetical protein
LLFGVFAHPASAVGAFSFASKKWGELFVGGTAELMFDEHAFDRLVLAGETKALLRALIEHTPHSFQDIIAGKGAGCIFALHGPPGIHSVRCA